MFSVTFALSFACIRTVAIQLVNENRQTKLRHARRANHLEHTQKMPLDAFYPSSQIMPRTKATQKALSPNTLKGMDRWFGTNGVVKARSE